VLPLTRGQIEWLYFDTQPMAAPGFSGAAADFDEWFDPSSASGVQVAGGVATIRQGQGIAHALPALPRFEIAFELPRPSEAQTRLFLQRSPALGPIATMETVTLELGRRPAIRGVIGDGDDRDPGPLPDGAEPAEPVSYRLLYDSIANRIAVLRDGHLEGNWEIRRTSAATGVQSFCFDRPHRSLEFRRLSVLPWDGIMPKDGQPPDARQPSGFEGLESIAKGFISIAGVRHSLEPGTFVRFASRTASLTEAESRLILRCGGELSAAGVRVEDGRVHGRTAFAADLDLPVEDFNSISFLEAPPPPDADDILVFKDGDELHGRLLRAAIGERLLWHTSVGGKIDFPGEHLAGVRFHTEPPRIGVESPGMLELKNGDRLCGTLENLNAQRAQVRNPGMGLVTVDRTALWRLSFDRRADTRDGACDPAGWLDGPPAENVYFNPGSIATPASRAWIYLDGRYVARTSSAVRAALPPSALQSPFPDGPPKYMVSFDVRNLAGGDPGCSLFLLGEPHGPVVGIWSYRDLQLLTIDSKGGESRFIPQPDRSSADGGRLNVQAFVDGPAGSARFYLDGVLAAESGKEKKDRHPGLGHHVQIRSVQGRGVPVVFSNIRISPWSGELPLESATEPRIVFKNGDRAAGVVKEMHAGKLQMQSAGGEFEIPLERAESIDFGGAVAPQKAAARLRFPDGSVIQADNFRCEGGEVTAHSAALGDLRFSVAALSDLALDPLPLQPPPPLIIEPENGKAKDAPVRPGPGKPGAAEE
jgi:hypothetical protein